MEVTDSSGGLEVRRSDDPSSWVKLRLIFVIFGLGWSRWSDLRSHGPPKSRSLSKF